MTVTFWGSDNTPPDMYSSVESIVETLILHHNADTFLVRNENIFDRMAKAALELLSKQYPHVNYYIVPAYCKNETSDSNIIILDELKGLTKELALETRNKWLINKCNTVVTYGLQINPVEFAHERKKSVITLFN